MSSPTDAISSSSRSAWSLSRAAAASAGEHAEYRQTDHATDEEADHSAERGFASQLVVICSFGGDPPLVVAAQQRAVVNLDESLGLKSAQRVETLLCCAR